MAAREPDARRDARRYLHTKYEAYFAWGYVQTTFEDVVRDAFIVGDPAACIGTIRRYREELGITCPLARVQWPETPQAVALWGIPLLREHVLPASPAGDEGRAPRAHGKSFGPDCS